MFNSSTVKESEKEKLQNQLSLVKNCLKVQAPADDVLKAIASSLSIDWVDRNKEIQEDSNDDLNDKYSNKDFEIFEQLEKMISGLKSTNKAYGNITAQWKKPGLTPLDAMWENDNEEKHIEVDELNRR